MVQHLLVYVTLTLKIQATPQFLDRSHTRDLNGAADGTDARREG